MKKLLATCVLVLAACGEKATPQASPTPAVASSADTNVSAGATARTLIPAMPRFALTVPEAGSYLIRVNLLDATSHRPLAGTATVLDQTDEEVVTFTGSGSFGEETRLAAGVYHVRVRANDGARANAELTWSSVARQAPAASIANAGEVSVDVPRSEVEGTHAYVDIAYTVASAQRINLRAGPGSPWISILHDDETELGHPVNIRDGYFTLTGMQIAPGRYRIRVKGSSNEGGTYRVTVAPFVPAPVVGRLQGQGSIRVEMSGESNAEDPGIEFIVRQAGSYQFRATAVGNGDPKLTLRNAAGESIATDDDTDGKNPRITAQLEPGTYRIELGRFGTGPLTADVSATPSANVPAEDRHE